MKEVKVQIFNELVFDHNGGFICSGKKGLQEILDSVADHYWRIGRERGYSDCKESVVTRLGFL